MTFCQPWSDLCSHDEQSLSKGYTCIFMAHWPSLTISHCNQTHSAQFLVALIMGLFRSITNIVTANFSLISIYLSFTLQMPWILLPSKAESINWNLSITFSLHWNEEDKSIIVTLNIIILIGIIIKTFITAGFFSVLAVHLPCKYIYFHFKS